VQAHQLRGEATERRRRALLTRELDRTIKILQQRAHMPLDRFEAAFGHLWGQNLQRPGIGKASRERFGKQGCIDTRPLGQCHYFGNHQCVAGHDHLIACLGHLPRPHAAHVRHPLAEGEQYRARTLQVGSFATDHDCQGAGLGARRTTGYRRIQPSHAAQGSQLGGHLAGGGRLEAGEVDQQLPAAPAPGNALLAEHHLAHHRRVGQAQQHHVAASAQFGRACRQLCACSDQLGALVRAAVPYCQRVARRQQAPAHRQAHQADAGESKRR